MIMIINLKLDEIDFYTYIDVVVYDDEDDNEDDVKNYNAYTDNDNDDDDYKDYDDDKNEDLEDNNYIDHDDFLNDVDYNDNNNYFGVMDIFNIVYNDDLLILLILLMINLLII